MTVTLPDLPDEESTDWYPHYQAIDAAVRDSSPWMKAVDLPLTSLAGWVPEGTTGYVATAGYIEQTSIGNAFRYLRYDGAVIPGACVLDIEIKVLGGSGANVRAGVTLGYPRTGASGGAMLVFTGDGTNVTGVYAENMGLTAISTAPLANPIAYGTWMRLRVERAGNVYRVLVNGVPVTAFTIDTGNGERPRVALYSYNSSAQWRRLTVWTPKTPPLPSA